MKNPGVRYFLQEDNVKKPTKKSFVSFWHAPALWSLDTETAVKG